MRERAEQKKCRAIPGSRLFYDRRLLLFLVSLLVYSLVYAGYLYSQEADTMEMLLAEHGAGWELMQTREEPVAIAEAVAAFLPAVPELHRAVRAGSAPRLTSRRGERSGRRLRQGKTALLLHTILLTAVFTLPEVIVRGAILCPSNRFILQYIENQDGSK